MFDAFLKMEGISGESRDDRHPEWIEILEFSHSINNVASLAGGGNLPGSPTTSPDAPVNARARARARARVSFSDFSIVKSIDSASPLIYLACCNGKFIQTVILEVYRSGGEETKILKIQLDSVVITNVSYGTHTQDGDGYLVETVTLNFERISWTCEPNMNDGATGGLVEEGWDLCSNAQLSGMPTTPPRHK